MKEREPVEWVNTWWSEADSNCRRGLLIGDSVIRQIRGCMEVLLKNLYAVDLFASSFSVNDDRMEDYISLLFKEYEYDFIVLNCGGHHGFSRLCCESSDECMLYEENYLKLLRYLLGKCGKVVCVTGTSEVLETNIDIIDQNIEKEIVIRNRIVKEAARKLLLEVFELNALMKRNQKVYAYVDRWHFQRSSDYFISYNLLDFMRSKNLIDSILICGKCKCAREKLSSVWTCGKKCIIYGTGQAGVKLYWILKWYGMESEIGCFAVSKEVDQNNIFGKPIVLIHELTHSERANNVLIIASDKYKDEMFQTAVRLHIQQIISYDYVINTLLQEETN